ncbi:hypothetical protein [Actinomyces respiraculi]|uniref:hypothetical protein n=1 Tax=Actinomyces respiraculi TaxID=2744574 RepID=UPI00141F55D3|nr:hypothetical protein [Actinomyces respiraculi]
MSEPGTRPEEEMTPETPEDLEAPEDRKTPAPVDVLTDEEEPTGARSRPRRPARRGRLWRRALVALTVLVLVLAAAAAGAEHVVRGRVGDVVHAAVPGLCTDAEVSTQGILLAQALTGSLDTLTVTSPCFHLEREGPALDLRDVTATLTGVGIEDPYSTQTLNATGTITWEDLSALVVDAAPALEEATAAPEEYGTVTAPGTFTIASEVLRLNAVLVVVPSLAPDGGLLLTVTRASLAGVGIDLDDEDSFVTTLLGTQTPEVVITRDLLPQGLSFSAVIVTEEGLRVSMSGQDLDLATLST